MATSILKSILLATLLPAVAAVSFAQESTDTLASHLLDEVVVQAPKVIRKSDMDVYYPSRSAIDNSRNGVQLLSNLMIPSLSLTDALGTVKAAGHAVQLRINGRVVSIDDVRALVPSSVRRVEWIDNPGLRYGGATYVLNFIVANPAIGGSLQTNVRQALNAAWGEYFADSKLNNGPSQFEFGGVFKLTENIPTHRDYRETFTYSDGHTLERTESPLGGDLDNSFGRAWASYSYVRPDTTVFHVEARSSATFTENWVYSGLLSLSDGSDDILLTDSHGTKGVTPGFSAYLEQHFSRRQTLVVDLGASFYSGRSYSGYIERLPDASAPLTDIPTMIRDRNQAYAVEADYIRSWRTSRLTAGASYTANRNRSVYENLGGQVFHQRQDKAYFFAEYFHRFDRITLTAGLGAQYTDFRFRETGQGSDSWNLRPQATVTYTLNPAGQFRLSFESWQSTPTLAQTNVAPQPLDGFQWRIGNPDLKTSNSYMLTLRYDYNLPRLSGSVGMRGFTSPDAITPYLYWDADRLITTYENSRGFRNLSFFLAPQIDILPGWIMVGGYLQYRMELMRGTGYRLTNHNWSGNLSLMLTHWGFTLSGQYVRAQHDLWGEKISWGENISVVQLACNWSDWQFGAGIVMPFGQYDQGSRLLSRWNTNEQHMRVDMRMPFLSVSYSLQWGRRNNSARKLISADTTVDTSTPGGR